MSRAGLRNSNPNMHDKSNVIVLGGSYAGARAARVLAKELPSSHRVILIEKNSHMQHLYVLPRYLLLSGHDHKAFIPYNDLFTEFSHNSAEVIQARVDRITPTHIEITRLPSDTTDRIPYSHLIYALGSHLPSPLKGMHEEIVGSMKWMEEYRKKVSNARDIILVGGGALGIRDIAEIFPDKRLLPKYDPKMHELIYDRLRRLNVDVVAGQRVTITREGDGDAGTVTTADGRVSASGDLLITCTGQKYNSSLLSSLSPSSVHPSNDSVLVRDTLQLADEIFSNVYAVGDVADTGAPKTGNAGYWQAETAARNVIRSIREEAMVPYVMTPPIIKVSVGLRYRVTQQPDENGAVRVWDDEEGRDDLDAHLMWPLFGAKAVDILNG
ncbi:hypothetical protein PROFUN_00797 [Planoprotostelium fungivorum]|uniref:FAD/NAD(P)-binding domain-containing protein n=1 Tax=Planoprotostelium fungivorum TaxID=1890364 RepID=A0A2P6NZY5_9EUKA|nr:hypothetical protein PROFUN_00797 [Planoprotostelium fungivorum]